MKYFHIFIMLFTCVSISHGQDKTFSIQTDHLLYINGLDLKLKDYSSVSTNTMNLYNFLINGGRDLSISNGINNIKVTHLIEKTNISPDYILRVVKGKDKNGNSIIEKYHGNIHGIKNFFGTTSDGGYFRMTVNKYGYLTLTCRLSDGNIWSINPIRNFDIQQDGFVFFNQNDVIVPEGGYACGTDEMKLKRGDHQPNIKTRGSRDWYEQELGIASDSAMWARHGSVAATNAHNSDITASCEPDWSHPDLHDSLTTVIIEEIVSQTHADDPWTYHDVIIAGDAIAEFRVWGGFTTNPDTKKGASGNTWQGNVVGIAYVGSAGNPVTCGSFNVFMIKDLNSDTQNRNVESHERGHNMGCNHVTGNYIMRSSIGNPGFTNWKAISVDIIDQSIPAANCLDLIRLPITLISFEGQLEQNKITLYWEVSEEINNDYFEIEKLNSSNIFKSIATIESTSTGIENTFYEYQDNRIINGKNIYRLKQTDNNGAYSYSQAISINYTSAVYNEMVISPNPTRDYINIYSIGNAKQLNYAIYTMNGQQKNEGQQSIQDKGVNKIDVFDLKNGVYYIDFYIDSQHFQKMFIKY